MDVQDPSLPFIPTDGMYAENARAISCQDDKKKTKVVICVYSRVFAKKKHLR